MNNPKHMIALAPPYRLEPRSFGSNSECQASALKQGLPFYKGARAAHVHRVRRGVVFTKNDAYTHTALDFFCGNGGFAESSKTGYNRLIGRPPNGSVFCSTCEERAIHMGEVKTSKILSRRVKFSPRTKTSLKIDPK